MKKVLIFTTQEGHLSIAKAANQAFSKAGFKTQLTDVLPKKAFKLYTPIYRYFPYLYKVPYKIGEQDTVNKAIKMFVENKLKKQVKNEIKHFQPDLVVSANLFYNPAISKVLDYQKNHTPFINIITDPWTIHAGMFAKSAEFNLVYDEKSIKIGKKNRISKEKLVTIGWLVRNKFYKPDDLSIIRQKLDFKKNIFTILICGGSEGTNMILKIMPALLTIKRQIQVIVVCGSNKTLYKALSSFKKMLPKLIKTKISRLENLSLRLNIKLFRFTNKMPDLISISNLVVGKAGPNLIFEAVAGKKPFFAICHISGQEDGNLDLIRKKRLGIVEENTLKAIRLLRKIIDNPHYLDKFSPFIEKERLLNLEAGNNLIKIANKLV
ncbi:glycosyltransferase [Patescibacteria group bacterium]